MKDRTDLGEINIREFEDLVALGCSEQEVRWFFRDAEGNPASKFKIYDFCKKNFGLTFKQYSEQFGTLGLKLSVRRNQLALSEKSSAMAIFLGKNYLGQREQMVETDTESIDKMNEILQAVKSNADSEAE